ncbi:MAG: hypothetical protein WC830_18295 [Burkholderiales bacterium]
MNIPAHQYKHYQVCGLRIGSTIAFPELRALPVSQGAFPLDMEFEIGGEAFPFATMDTIMTMDEADGSPWLTCTRTTEGYRFHFSGLADFLVNHSGRHVNCVPQAETPPETIRHLFLDQVIPPLLNLRGSEALHASAIQIDGGAFAFIGMSGQGKSTLAAAFYAVGYPILCDDCLLLKSDADQVVVEPAYPGLRLWDDSRGFLFGDARATLPVSHYNDKRRICAPESSSGYGGLLPLHGIYSLLLNKEVGSTAAPLIEPLSIRDAFMELVSYAFRLDLTDQAMILRQMQFLERVAREVPLKRLRLPADLAALPAVREMILQDLKRV